jgi:UDP-glucose 4-epimerase
MAGRRPPTLIRPYPSPMRILVTGGAGYVGSVSVEALVNAGHHVVVVDNLATGHRWADLGGSELVEGTYTDRAFIAETLERREIDAVLHCGARSLVGESIRDPAIYFRENVAGGIELLEAMRDAGVLRLVISSTAAVYGVPESSPISEDAPLRPINPYGESKRSLEAAAGWFARAYGLRVASLRYFNVAGATTRNGETHDPETHLIPNALNAVAGGPPLTLYGTDYPTPDGTPIRDYVHVEDLAEAHRLALEATAPGDERTESMLICNLGSGVGFSVLEVLAAAEQVLGREIPHLVGERREGDPATLVASIDRAREVLRWAPVASTLEAMIGSAWAYRQSRGRGRSS